MSERPLLPPDAPEPARTQDWLRPPLVLSWTEFVLVAAVAMALPIHNSTAAALGGSSSRFMQMVLSNRQLLHSLFAEALLLALFLFYLRWRGWTPADLRIGIGWWTSAQGIALLVCTQLAVAMTVLGLFASAYALQTSRHTFLSFLLAFSPHLARHVLHVDWLAIFPAVVLNAFFEEIICMGYIFNQLAARRGPLLALIITVFLRVACHTYQDPFHLAGIAVLFSIYAVWYARTRRLWPLILAHILLDLGSFSFFKLMFG